MQAQEFIGQARQAVARALSGESAGAILEGSIGDGKEAAAREEIERSGASFWSVDLASALSRGSEAQALAGLSGAAPIFLAAGSIDCDPPAGFARVSDGKSRSLLGMAAREAGAPEGLSLEELAEEPSEAEREEPLEEARRAAPRRRG